MSQPAEQNYATGRRKASTARVYMRPGTGRIIVNKRDIGVYFERESTRLIIIQPLEEVDAVGDYDFFVNVKGGGKSGQAGAIRLGISRALVDAIPARRAALKSRGFLTRDARKVERKKYGQPGARKRFQFSKR